MSEDEKVIQQTPLCQTPVSGMLQFAAQLLPPADQPDRRPTSADSFFNHPMYHGYPGYTGAQLDDPAVLTDSTQFYANYNANYQPVCLDNNQMWYPHIFTPQQGAAAAGSMQNLVGGAEWIKSAGTELGRATIGERFINTSVPPPGIMTQAASDMDSQQREQPGSPSLEMAKEMLKELQVPAPKVPAVYAGDKVSQSQIAEVIPKRAEEHTEGGNTVPESPSSIKPTESPTEALMRALRACSPNAKVSAAAGMQPSRKAESEKCKMERCKYVKQVSAEGAISEDVQEEFLLTSCKTSDVKLCSPRKALNAAQIIKPVGSPKRILSDSSSPSGSPVKQGTPRKVRIAARFDVPIEATSDDSS